MNDTVDSVVPVTADQVFWPFVDKSGPDGCWEWVGPRHPAYPSAVSGYGFLSVSGTRIRAHRFSFILHSGGIPDGLVIDHLCRNPCCVNPEHLEAVTNEENVLRGVSPPAKNKRKTHCKRGHMLSEDNLYLFQGRRYCVTCRRLSQTARQRNPDFRKSEADRVRRYRERLASGERK